MLVCYADTHQGLLANLRKSFYMAQIYAHGAIDLGLGATTEQLELLGFAILDFAVAACNVVTVLLRTP
jgi:hypothetical protein